MTTQLSVRVSAELLAWLESDAKAHGRTVAQSIRFYLEQERWAQGLEEGES